MCGVTMPVSYLPPLPSPPLSTTHPPLPSQPPTPPLSSTHPSLLLHPPTLLPVSLLLSRLWREAVSDALIPRPELWSHPVIDGGFGNAVRTVCSQRQGQLEVAEQDGTEDRVSISSCEDFDWSLEDASPFLLNLRELSLGNVSPEAATVVAYLRSNVVSPVEVEMDIEQATAGAHTSMST